MTETKIIRWRTIFDGVANACALTIDAYYALHEMRFAIWMLILLAAVWMLALFLGDINDDLERHVTHE